MRRFANFATIRPLLTRAFQPAIWLLLFGQVMAHVRGLASDGGKYLDFLAPGILAQSVLFAAIFYGIAAMWERDLGVLHRYMVSPTPRTALVLGKAVSSAVRGLSQADRLCPRCAYGHQNRFRGVKRPWRCAVHRPRLKPVLDLFPYDRLRRQDPGALYGIGQVLTMPIFFASNAIYPIDLMPDWLKAISLGSVASLAGERW